MKCVAYYVVKEARTGEVVASGSSEECARRMGRTYDSFLTLVSRSRRGVGKYRVERLDDSSWRQEWAGKWDAAFGWYRAAPVPYPCKGCMQRACCEFTDTYCSRWAAWYRAAHRAAVAALKARDGHGNGEAG